MVRQTIFFGVSYWPVVRAGMARSWPRTDKCQAGVSPDE